MPSDFFKIILKSLFLILLGVGSMSLKYFGAEQSSLADLLERTSASPIVEPFLDYSTHLKRRDFFEYKIFAAGKLLQTGDHFQKVYRESGGHMRRIAHINEARARERESLTPPSDLFFAFYCHQFNEQKPDSFSIFKMNFSCAK